MTYQDLVKDYQEQVDSEVVEVALVEDYDVPQHACYVGGFFDPNWFENGAKTPIQVVLLVNSNADVEENKEHLDGIDSEFVMTLNHESIHLQQWKEGRFIEDWDGDYMENPNEIEAYANEGKGKLNFKNRRV